jgi:putative endonuclease
LGNRTTGQLGEDRAAAFLKERGFQIVERNFRCRYGEADIVVWDGRRIGLIEVKARSSTGFGLPAEAIGREKLRRMQRVAECWRQEKKPTQSIWIGVITILGEDEPALITEIDAID